MQRTVLSIEGRGQIRRDAAKKVIKKGLSVREDGNTGKSISFRDKKIKNQGHKDPQIASLEDKHKSLGTRKGFITKTKGGRI